MQKLTQKICDITQAPEQGKLLIRDSELKGFGLSVSGRSKSYFVECRVNGSKRRATIGRADLITLEDARVKARKLLAEMLDGFDPTAQKRNEKIASITLIELLEEYLQVRYLKKSSISSYRRAVKRSMRDWLNKPILEITKDMVEARHRQLSSGCSKGTSGKANANFCMKTLQSLLNYAAEKYEVDGKPLIAVNPVSRLTKTRAWNRVHPRQSVIPEYKFADWYKAIDSVSNKSVRDYFLLLLFTGIRKCEGSTLKWADLDFEAETLTIRRTVAKNHRDHVLPLPKFILDMLRRRHSVRTDNPYVFPGAWDKGHLTEFRYWIEEIRDKCGVKFMIHDTRRTFLTCAERLELPYYVLKRLANHVSNFDTLIPYIVVSIERLRLHMERIAAHLLGLMGLQQAAIACAQMPSQS